MTIHEILLVPSAGPISESRGHVVGNLVETDIVDRYVRALADALDDSGIRHKVVPVRKSPLVLAADRQKGIFPGQFVLHCGIGWSTKPPSKGPELNASKVYFAFPEANAMACLISECLGHWGKLYGVHEHRGCKPTVDDLDPLLKVPSGGVRLEPFILNGPDATLYASKLEFLGRDLGRTISDYLIAQNHLARNRPSSLNIGISR